MMKNISGNRYGRLIAIEPVYKDKFNQMIWKCKCDCGKETFTTVNRLASGKTKSCGCLALEIRKNMHRKHGLCYTRINSIYRKMKQRCLCKSGKRYKDYGGRGITICNEWMGEDGFLNFYNWSISHGYNDDLTIDRIDVNGNYSPDNCRWATEKQQNNNTRRNVYLTAKGITKTMAEWGEYVGISASLIRQRIFVLHWTTEDAIFTKVKEKTHV